MNFKEMIFDGDLSFYEDVINSSHIFVSKEVSTASEDAKDTSSWLKDLTKSEEIEDQETMDYKQISKTNLEAIEESLDMLEALSEDEITKTVIARIRENLK